MKTFSYVLKPSKSYGHRTGQFDLYSHPGAPAIGVLEVREQKKPTTKMTCRRFAVYELANRDDGRVFRLTKPMGTKLRSHDDDTEHHVVLSWREHDRCTCRGFMRFGYCTHAESLRALSGVGKAIGPVSPRPVSPRPVSPRPVSPRPVSPRPVSPRPVSPRPVSPRPALASPLPERAGSQSGPVSAGSQSGAV